MAYLWFKQGFTFVVVSTFIVKGLIKLHKFNALGCSFLIGGTLEDDDLLDSTSSSSSQKSKPDDSTDADIVAYFLMMLGWFIIIRSLTDYFRAKQMEKIICSEPTPESIV